VLSLPPAFVLSQDQTLKFIEIFNPDWSPQSSLKTIALLTSSKHIRFKKAQKPASPPQQRPSAFKALQSAMIVLKRDRRLSLSDFTRQARL
jgi:hypothetical protein